MTDRRIADFSLDFFSLAGRRAIVTGGNSGLGKAYSVALAEAGADIYIPTLVDDGGATLARVTATGVRAAQTQIDLTTDGAAAAVVAGCRDALGGLDILVNNAGICLLADDVRDFGRPQWDPMVAVNLTAAFELSREAAIVMIPQGSGKIINVCSMFSFLGGLRSPAYAATKHGMAGLTKAYADELGGFGIQVNAIAPGYFATELTTATRQNPATDTAVRNHIPAGSWGHPQDLMGAIVFLASRAADYVNGHILTVDGGYLVR